VLRTLFGLKLSKAELATFKRHTGRTAPAKGGYREAWFICGRGGGKSFTLALCAVYLACFRDWRQYMVPGERGVVMVIAVDRKQAAGIFEYMRALLEVPMMLPLVQRVTQESIDLVGGISIEVHTCNYRSVRGRTIVAALLDEVAFWQSEDTANPDQEVIRALRPGLGRVPGSLLLCASTPYARKGALHQTYTRDYGKDDSPRLVWKATTQEMNCTFSQQVIDDALAEDEPHARAEYFAEFRSDVEQYIKLDTVLACCESYAQRFPTGGIQYQAFVDPSGGNSDSFTAAVGHRQDGKIHVDWLYECRAPFSPEEAVAEICNELRSYNVRQVVGDNYAGEWPKDAFARHAVQYRPASLNKVRAL
jgi:hypothetical protein